MDFDAKIVTENQPVFLPILNEKKIALFIKREDAIHPFVSGNKFRKLKYNIQEAIRQKKSTILTFGGAFSNHIVATAVAANKSGLKTVGVIRGEELGKDVAKTLAKNPTLQQAHKNGMQFLFVTREAYRNKNNVSFITELQKNFGDFYIVPEGGTNTFAVQGCEEILTSNDANFNYICSPVGTGGTIAGLINSATKTQKVIGFAALKGDFLQSEVAKWVKKDNNWRLIFDYHFGGYAKYNADLIDFINDFKIKTNILLDPIYTAKMIFGILDLANKNYFLEGSKILAIHTGGLQGVTGFNKMLQSKNNKIITD